MQLPYRSMENVKPRKTRRNKLSLVIQYFYRVHKTVSSSSHNRHDNDKHYDQSHQTHAVATVTRLYEDVAQLVVDFVLIPCGVAYVCGYGGYDDEVGHEINIESLSC